MNFILCSAFAKVATITQCYIHFNTHFNHIQLSWFLHFKKVLSQSVILDSQPVLLLLVNFDRSVFPISLHLHTFCKKAVFPRYLWNSWAKQICLIGIIAVFQKFNHKLYNWAFFLHSQIFILKFLVSCVMHRIFLKFTRSQVLKATFTLAKGFCFHIHQTKVPNLV